MISESRSFEAVRAVVYTRISHDESGDASGVDRQRADCLQYCQQRGWEVIEVVTDNDVSASQYARRQRPGYRRALELVEGGSANAIVAWHLDRLWRRPRELEDLIERAEQGLIVATLSGDYDLTNRDDRFHARILASVAAKSSDDSSARLRRQRRQAAESGLPAGYTGAFGYERGIDGHGLRVVEAEATLIRRAAQTILDGGTLSSIAREWNDRGVPQVHGGRGWNPTVLRKILTSARVAGLRSYKGEIVAEAAWPAILDRETWERVRAILEHPARRQTHPRRKSLLTGFLVCGKCGHSLTRGNVHGHVVWKCHVQTSRPNCGGIQIAGPAVEATIVDAVLYRLDSATFAEALKAPSRRRNVVDDAGAVISRLERELEVLAEDYGTARISRREWIAARKPLEARLNNARNSIQSATNVTVLKAIVGSDVRERWCDLDLERQRAVLAALIDHVTIAPADRVGPRSFNLERIDISWKL